MDLAAAAGKTTPESDPDSSTRIHTPKPVSFSNGVLKRNTHSGPHNNNNHGGGSGGGSGIGGVVVYKECLKNHAASLGTHAVDGCGEFMPSPTCISTDPTSLKCAACGCHRNFHRREPEDSFHLTTNTNITPSLEYQPHHRHHPPQPQSQQPPPPPRDGGGGEGGGGDGSHSSPSSPSPPPISSSYYPSAPHLLLTLSGGIPVAVAGGGGGGHGGGNSSSHSQDHHHHHHHHNLTSTQNIGNRGSPAVSNGGGRKRFRTRFTQNQKGKMMELAEKLGWKMQKRDEELIIRFCNEIGVEKGVFKVWMHNNKNIFGKTNNPSIPTSAAAAGGLNHPNSIVGSNGIAAFVNQSQEIQNEEESGHHNFNGRVVCPNGSSSSS